MNNAIFTRAFLSVVFAFVVVMAVGISNETLAQRFESTYLVHSGDNTIGLAPGQTLRFTFFNPTPNTVAGPHIRVFSGGGTLLLDARHTPLGAGKFDSFDINYSDLEQVPAENGTGRRQIRTDMTIVYTGLEWDASRFRPTWELIDTARGETLLIGMLIPAIQKVR